MFGRVGREGWVLSAFVVTRGSVVDEVQAVRVDVLMKSSVTPWRLLNAKTER